MSIEKQIEKTKEVIASHYKVLKGSGIAHQNQLILENQLVILETLKKLEYNTTKRDRSQFGPG